MRNPCLAFWIVIFLFSFGGRLAGQGVVTQRINHPFNGDENIPGMWDFTYFAENDSGYVMLASDGRTYWSGYLLVLDSTFNIAGDRTLPNSYYTRKIIPVEGEGFLVLLKSWVYRLDNQGDTIWTINTTGFADDLRNIELNADGSFYLIGKYNGPASSGEDIQVMRLNASGQTIWSRLYDFGGDEEPMDLAIISENELAILGKKGSTSPLFRIDSTGNLLSAKSFGGTHLKISASVDRSLYVLGSRGGTFGGSSSNPTITLLDSLDQPVWKRFIRPSGNFHYPYLKGLDISTLSNNSVALAANMTGLSFRQMPSSNFYAPDEGSMLAVVNFAGELNYFRELGLSIGDVKFCPAYDFSLDRKGRPTVLIGGGYTYLDICLHGLCHYIYEEYDQIIHRFSPPASPCWAPNRNFILEWNNIPSLTQISGISVIQNSPSFPTSSPPGNSNGVFSGAIPCDNCPAPQVSISDSGMGLNFQFWVDPYAGVDDSVSWDFGDGNTGSGAYVQHTYLSTGDFTVVVSLTNGCGSDSDTLQLSTCSLAEFTLTDSVLCPGDSIFAQNLSVQGDTFFWYVDGILVDTTFHLATTGFAYGEHTVSLVAATAFCRDTLQDTLRVDTLRPVAGFTYSHNLLAVSFTDASQNAVSWNWDFGDSTFSNIQAPTHTYAASGAYQICQTANSLCYGDTYCDSFACIQPVSDFRFRVMNDSVMFYSLAQDYDSLVWDFGDGTGDTAMNPVHVYANTGSYSVRLRAFAQCGAVTKTKTVIASFSDPGDLYAFRVGVRDSVKRVREDFCFGRQDQIYSVGYFSRNQTDQIFVECLDRRGQLVWSRFYASGHGEKAQSVDMGPNYEVWVSGITQFQTNGGGDPFLMRLDSFGNIIEFKKWTGNDNEFHVEVKWDTIHTKGYLIGTTRNSNFGFGGRDVFVMQLDSSGNMIWSNVYGSTGNQEVSDFEIHRNGELFILTDWDDAEPFNFPTSFYSNPQKVYKISQNGYLAEKHSFNLPFGSNKERICGFSLQDSIIGFVGTALGAHRRQQTFPTPKYTQEVFHGTYGFLTTAFRKPDNFGISELKLWPFSVSHINWSGCWVFPPQPSLCQTGSSYHMTFLDIHWNSPNEFMILGKVGEDAEYGVNEAKLPFNNLFVTTGVQPWNDYSVPGVINTPFVNEWNDGLLYSGPKTNIHQNEAGFQVNENWEFVLQANVGSYSYNQDFYSPNRGNFIVRGKPDSGCAAGAKDYDRFDIGLFNSTFILSVPSDSFKSQTNYWTSSSHQISDSVVLPNILVECSNECQGPELIISYSIQGDSIYLSAPNGFNNYKWTWTGNSNLYSGPDQSIQITGCDTIMVTLMAESNCGKLSTTKEILIQELYSPQLIMPDSISCVSLPHSIIPDSGMAAYGWSTGDSIQNLVITAPGNYFLSASDSLGCRYFDSVSVLNPIFLSTELPNDTFACPDENLFLEANQALVNPVWSTGDSTFGVQVFANGTYHFAAQDSNGCEFEDSVSVIFSEIDTLELPPDTVLCEPSTVELNFGGAVSSVLINNSPGQSPFTFNTTGNYFLLARDSFGCRIRDSAYYVFHPSPPPMAWGADTVLCTNESRLLSAPQGRYSYLWSTGDTTREIIAGTPGTYSVTITNIFNCTMADSFNLSRSNLPLPNPLINPEDSFPICPGKSVMLEASQPGNIYRWSTGESTQAIWVNQPGQYYCKISNIDSCSVFSDTIIGIEITQPAPTPFIVQSGGTFLVLPLGMPGYQWYQDGQEISGADSSVFTPGSTGYFQVIVTDSNGCEGGSDAIFISVGIAPELLANGTIDIFPNPTSGHLVIRPSSPMNEPVDLALFDARGKLVQNLRGIVIGDSKELNLKELSDGDYFLRISSGDAAANFKILLIR